MLAAVDRDSQTSSLLWAAITLLLLIVFTGGIVLYVGVIQPKIAASQQRVSLQHVFEQRLVARRAAVVQVMGNVGISKAVYLPLLQKIDTSGCPPQFRFAWDVYVVAWQQQGNDSNAKGLHNAKVVTTAVATDNPLALLGLESATPQDVTTAPFRECQRIAAEFGYYSPDIPVPELAKPPGVVSRHSN